MYKKGDKVRFKKYNNEQQGIIVNKFMDIYNIRSLDQSQKYASYVIHHNEILGLVSESQEQNKDNNIMCQHETIEKFLFTSSYQYCIKCNKEV